MPNVRALREKETTCDIKTRSCEIVEMIFRANQFYIIEEFSDPLLQRVRNSSRKFRKKHHDTKINDIVMRKSAHNIHLLSMKIVQAICVDRRRYIHFARNLQ